MKNITKLMITTFCVLFSNYVLTQNSCNETLSLFSENVKTQRYEEAKPQLAFLRKNCAALNYAVYAYGEILLNHEITISSSKKAIATSLIELYKERILHFPKKTPKGKFLPKIASLMIMHDIGTTKEQYLLFNEALQTDEIHFKNPKGLYQYFELLYKLHQSGELNISVEKLMEKYETIREKLLILQKKSAKNKAAINTFLSNMDILIEKVATCKTLIPIYEKKFNTMKNDVEWIRKVANILDQKSCEDELFFFKLITEIDELEPTAQTKLYLYKVHQQQNNTLQANKYLKEYVVLETDNLKITEVLHSAGNEAVAKGQKSKARSYYEQALNASPTAGAVYLSLARLYASSANECGSDEFTKRAIYWKAAESARKAMNIDFNVKKEANRLLETYTQSAPSKIDIFNKGYKGGEKITFDCWFGGFVTVPKL
ncbi:tetratricopeptide repeat protein [Kordia zhangzhouensis]|uniref:tetratricopeptide repeat protein n=1 Tax=Kordia zhangzhouensis TaxID=1620405 RepID=UPI0006296EBC|nr:hypothetical protein [Kordia zhangzhouensis]